MENLETHISETKAQENIEVPDSTGTDGLLFFSVLFLIISFIFLIIGFIKLANPNDAAELVGGDAYNFIIHSIRASGYLLVALISGLISGIFGLYSILSKLKRKNE